MIESCVRLFVRHTFAVGVRIISLKHNILCHWIQQIQLKHLGKTQLKW